MSSYVKIEVTLWGGLPSESPIKEDVVEAAGTFLLAHQSMAEGASAPTQTFFDELSDAHTTLHLRDIIYKHRYAKLSANTTYPHRYFDPSEYKITEIVILKQRLFIQHEGFIFRVHHSPIGSESPTQPNEPDFTIAINRSTHAKSFFSSPKFAIDRVDCSLSPAAQQIEGTISHPVVWRMPAPGHSYRFDFNLSQVGVLLDAILFSYPQKQLKYNALYKNCFSHSRVIRDVIIQIIQEQQQPAGDNVVVAYEPNPFGVTIGTCFGFRLDRDKGEDVVVFANYRNLYAQFLS